MDLPDKSATPQSQQSPPEKRIKPVVQGVQGHRPATRRFFDFLFAESPKTLVGEVGKNVLVPRAKAGLEEALNSFIAGMFWGGGQRPMSNLISGAMMRGGGVNYNLMSTQQSALQQAMAQQNQQKPVSQYEDVVCGTKDQAEFLLANMIDLYNQYRVVTVADLYELANIPTSPMHNGLGWTSLDSARIVQNRNGFALELPRPSVV